MSQTLVAGIQSIVDAHGVLKEHQNAKLVLDLSRISFMDRHRKEPPYLERDECRSITYNLLPDRWIARYSINTASGMTEAVFDSLVAPLCAQRSSLMLCARNIEPAGISAAQRRHRNIRFSVQLPNIEVEAAIREQRLHQVVAAFAACGH